ncbi:MAG: NUDIX hydrolase N-terminal domain-containing protein, partial [Acetobacteraceae bacterium]|nr:NUDIX hydrolase N-terminal domain-containing protein [Acetobacteraceae bacterium]
MPGAEPGLAYFRDRGLTVSRDPDWLAWAREIQAIAQTGLAFTKDPYDAERYVSLRALAARIMAAHTDSSADRILDLFSREAGYAT